MKNLEEIDLYETDKNINVIIDALVASKCENLLKVHLKKEWKQVFLAIFLYFYPNKKI